MKHFLQQANKSKSALFYITLVTLLLASGCIKVKEPPVPVLKISTLSTGFSNPIGLETDKSGNVWVGAGGTGQNDGKVWVITPDGRKYEAIINLPSTIDKSSGDVDGPTHLLFADGLLYISGGAGKLYKADVSSFKPGDAAIKASTLGVEDIGAFVMAYNFVHKTGESHVYGLRLGPNGDIYIADAAANAIIHRSKTGVLSVLAEVPSSTNPTPVGPPQIESVPTGIIYDGQNFLVSTLTGFPFLTNQASIYKISTMGAVSLYQKGFTTLVDIAEGGSLGHLVLEHGTFGAMGFNANTGRLVWANGTTATELAKGLNLPAGLTQANEHTWYVTSLGDGSVLKVTY